jgi:tetratricopeptide (TPR) repeat protein
MRASLTLTLCLFLSGPALAEDLPAEELAVAAAVLSDEARTAAFAPYLEAVVAGDADAVHKLLPLLEDEALSDLHGEVWLNLARQLEGLGDDWSIAATHAFSEAIRLDGDRSAPDMLRALEVARSGGDVETMAGALSEQIGAPMDSETRSEVSLEVARWHLREGNLGQAAGLLYTVDRSASSYADSRNLLGVVLTHQGKPDSALGPLAEAQAIGKAEKRPDRWNNMVELNLARAFFTSKNWQQSVYHYAQIQRGSQFWPEAQFERAWAHFRADDMTGTLATLMSPNSEFFADWYFAEASLLRVYALFMMCKFSDASAEIDAFTERYQPEFESLTPLMANMTVQDAWDDVSALRADEATQIPFAVLQRYNEEDRFSDAFRAVASIDAALTSSEGTSDPLLLKARGWLAERKSSIVEAQGARVLAHVRSVHGELENMLQGVELTRLDMLNLEAQMYERAAATGDLDYGDKVGKLRDLRARQKRAWVWPFEGEYWVDELGYYRIDARPDCPSGMASGS